MVNLINLVNLVNMKKRIGDTDYGWILPLGILAAGGFLIWKFFGSGSSAGSQNNAAIDASTAATAASDLAASQAAGVQQSLPDSTLNTMSDTLYQLIGNYTGDYSSIDNVVTQVQNNTDWYRLLQIFGTKKFNSSGSSFNSCALTGGLFGCDSWDLGSALKNTLPAEAIANINTYFSDQGMSITL